MQSTSHIEVKWRCISKICWECLKYKNPYSITVESPVHLQLSRPTHISQNEQGNLLFFLNHAAMLHFTVDFQSSCKSPSIHPKLKLSFSSFFLLANVPVHHLRCSRRCCCCQLLQGRWIRTKRRSSQIRRRSHLCKSNFFKNKQKSYESNLKFSSFSIGSPAVQLRIWRSG